MKLNKSIHFNLISLAVLAFATALIVFEFSQAGFTKSIRTKKSIVVSCGYSRSNSTYASLQTKYSMRNTASRNNDLNQLPAQKNSGDKNNCAHQSATQTSLWSGSNKKNRAHLC